MLARRRILLLLAVGLPVAGQTDKSPQAGKGTRMSKQTEDVKEWFARFDETKDPVWLEDAIRGLENADPRPEPGQDRLAARRERMLLWLAVLATLQRTKDPTFDPKDLPMMNISPPPGSSGVRYPAGVDPKSIPETDVRAQYEAALAKNGEKINTYRLQSRLLFLEERAQPGVENFIRRYYTKSDPDRVELKELVEKTQIPPAKKQRLLSLELR